MRITATAFLAFTAVATAKTTPKADGARKLGNDNAEYSGYYNNNGNSGNINDYMSNLNYYTNARDQKSQYGYYSQNAREYDQDQQEWQESMQGQRSWGSANYGQTSTTSVDTRWMGDYSIKFEGCATDYDSNRYGQAKTELLAKFKLCPNNSKSCRNGGEYVVPMSDYVNAFENLVMTDENCAAQQEVCYNQCLMQARYGEAYDADNNGGGGRRLGNNNNKNNNNNEGNEQYNNAKQQYYEYHNYNADKNGEWQDYQQQYYEENTQDEESEEYQQAKAAYYGNIDYTQYNGGNYATAQRNGQYDGANANEDVDYDEYISYYESQNQDNNYYDRENSNWRANYFDEEYCRYDCMADAGMDYCIENRQENGGNNGDDGNNGAYGYNDEINAPAAMVECHQLDYYSGDAQPLFVGAACRDGGVYLETFTDSSCTQVAPQGTHEGAVGYSLPGTNLVNEQELPCSGTMTYMHNQYFGNWDEANEYAQQQQQQATSVCEALYQNSGKCEAHMKISDKNTAGCDYIHRMSGLSRFSKWLHYGIGLVIAACLLLAAYIGYSRAKTEDLHITVKTIQTSVEGSMEQMSSSVNAMLQQAGKSLKEPLAPTGDDATVTSADSAPTTQYEAATVPDAPSEQPPTEAAVV